MRKYILKRIGYMLITLFIVVTITFFLIHTIPGDSLGSVDEKFPEQTRTIYDEKDGSEKPIYVQYGLFLKNIFLEGELGESIRYPGRSVTETIGEHAIVSGKIGIIAIVLGLLIGIAIGVLAALNRNKWPDYLLMFIAVIGISIPSFVMASFGQYFLTVKTSLLPTFGWGSPKNYILPVLILSLGSLASYARYMRSSVLDTMNQDFIVTAKAKGIGSFNIVRKHILRNALFPVITILGSQIAGVFVGSFIVEKIFGIPGLGSYYINSISDRDYTMILGITIFYATLFILSQLIIDIIYGIVDPRIKLSKEGSRGG